MIDRTGPAFPETRYAGNTNRHATDTTPGMTLRDYFAGQALAGMLANPQKSDRGADGPEAVNRFAFQAYRFAAAMLDEREEVMRELERAK